MNILIPHPWLLEHLETDASPLEIQKYLSLCGPSVERIYDREGEAVYDMEITTNRVDSMSVRGIAREAAVILPQFGKKAKLKKLELPKVPTKAPTQPPILPLPTIINDEKLCKRTLCVVLAGAERTATPEWMAKRLRQTEMNVHDAVIDITNYVTHELGHPCHAFDYDRVMKLGGMIIVKRAKAGKKFTTLDGVEYTTVGGEVVFENDKGIIIDLPGIKGTANTSIATNTKNVLFWLESIEAKHIRFASMTHAIRTTAAQLNEKNVDPVLASSVFAEGVALFEKLTGAQQASAVYDDFPAQKKPPTIRVELTRITEYLGVELSVNTMAKILEKLECVVELRGGALFVTPPTFRPDIEIPADVIEEIARIYGYHNLPSVLMPTAIPLTKPATVNFAIEHRIKHFLADIGWQELYTYSMVSEAIAQQSGFALSEHLKIQNPLTDDRVYVRRSLVPSLVEAIDQNSQRKTMSVFELANIYPPQPGDLPSEKLQLALVSSRPYREVKGDVESLLRHFFMRDVTVRSEKKAAKMFHQSASIVVKDRALGTIGVLENGYVAINMDMSIFLQVAKTHPSYQPIPKTSEVIEDLTFTLPPHTEIGPMLTELAALSTLIRTVTLKDVYEQNYTLTMTYNDPQKNIEVTAVEPIRRNVVSHVEKEWQGKLVGSIQ